MRTRGNLPRRSRSAPQPWPSGQSCPQGRRPRSGAADHPAWVGKRAATAVPDTLPDGGGHAGPRDCAQGAARSPDMSAHPPACSILLEFKECLLEVIDTDVVEERGELLLLPLPCSLPYAFQRLGHAHPVLRPARALLARISLGLRPWLRRLRSGSLRLVRRLPSYYGGV